MDMESFTALMEQASGKTSAALLPFIDSITAKTSGGNTVYTLKLNDAFAGIINGLMGQIMSVIPQEEGLDMDMSFTLDGSTITYTVDKDGALKSAAVDLTLKADLGASDGQDSLAVSVSMDMDTTMDVKALGKDVKISFPDFSDFEELLGGADGPTAIMGTVTF